MTSRATWRSLSPSSESSVIIGLGVDICQVDRLTAMLERRPGLMARLFTDAEVRTPDGKPRSGESLAARFCAKEALAKALGSPGGMSWLDAEVTTLPNGAPELVIRGTVAARAAECEVAKIHLSLSHDGGLATAFVICEGKT